MGEELQFDLDSTFESEFLQSFYGFYNPPLC